ncbi:VWA domain-containing protein [Paenibacillus sonchi]|uniref:VWA domain-containing protein n=1 Tax=Paenibacillus sonchi TaxID=373687 RepID=A0A974P7Q3_9BACL|nr:VWA domain-containing protein [Paenibacillus sonchi]QQZ58964.1 VWA domain-containing protein [Paenibacillus sonchi]
MNESVLNTDSFDRRRFEQIMDMSAKLQEVERKGESAFPTLGPLLGDVWAGLFKMNPQLLPETPPELQMNRVLMERVMNEEAYHDLREFTRLDDIASALGTARYSETITNWIDQQIKDDEEWKKQITEGTAGNQEAMTQAVAALQQALEADGGKLSQALQQAGNQVREDKGNLISIFGGLQAGSGEAELRKVPLREQIRFGESLANNKKMKQIAEWAGRLKVIAQKKQRTKAMQTTNRSGVTMGNAPEHLLPAELMLLSHPATRLDTLRRYAEGQLLQYELKGQEQLGKGPIVLCLDQSGSMSSQDTRSKGFTLALMSIARKQRRDFALIPFSGSASKPLIYERGKITVQDMINLAEMFRGGGTNFESPLNQASKVIQNSGFNKADIVFVTDGDANVSNEFLDRWKNLKAKREIRVLSILLGTEKASEVELFSDRIVKASSFEDEAVYQVFEI